jgi:hypothetical protein
VQVVQLELVKSSSLTTFVNLLGFYNPLFTLLIKDL